jgi:hypothetical protein
MITPSRVLGSVVGKDKIGKAERKMSRGHSSGKSIRTRGYWDLLGEGGTRDRILRRRGRRGRDFSAGAQHVDEEPVVFVTRV